MIEFEKRFFESKGGAFVENGTKYHMSISVNSGPHLGMHVRFMQAIKKPRQGIRFDSNSLLQSQGISSNSFVFWRNTAPAEFNIGCAANSNISIRNVWAYEDGVEHSWHAGGAMIVEEEANLIRIRANSTLLNDLCEDLVIEISWLNDFPQDVLKKTSWFSRLLGCRRSD